MVALSFGSYASDMFAGGSVAGGQGRSRSLLVVAMTALNVAGSTFVARVQSLVVFVVIGILAVFAVVTMANIQPALLAPSGYPGAQDIVSSVALTFFAFLGFGVVTFTAKDLADPGKQLPKAMAIAIGLATVIYVAVSLGVFGTLTVTEVIAAGPTAIAVAAQPVLGEAGYWLMSVTALFATAGATNAGPLPGRRPVRPPRLHGPVPDGHGAAGSRSRACRADHRRPSLILRARRAVRPVAVASIGSAVALIIFALVTLGAPAGSSARPGRAEHPRARPGDDRDHAADVHVHDPDPRAGVDRDPGRDPALSIVLDLVVARRPRGDPDPTTDPDVSGLAPVEGGRGMTAADDDRSGDPEEARLPPAVGVHDPVHPDRRRRAR